MNLENLSTEALSVDNLTVVIAANREQMGLEAAKSVAEKIREIQQKKETVNMIFASAPSQNEFLTQLKKEQGIAWEQVNAFHMDEYIGLESSAPQNFATFLEERLFNEVAVKNFFRLNGNAEHIEDEIVRYTSLLTENPVDIICMGIGENCHIAFNDPHVADFNDPVAVKVVELDETSRIQQVNDGCFGSLDEVPTHALTLTIPTLIAPPHIYCMVPGPLKAQAIEYTLKAEISPTYPSTILREHPDARLFIDTDSASLLDR
jgi:glucosamine-6-phosphate deaminase